ncbi:unnamed protein product [Rotaria sordida]|uniref:Uncharacterized protein n=1 Tax=Rotaria sordida TaxID=392033 RepID=A0A815G2F1_9BILA|nr:unnamed protein product [Rotaria sordida]
MFLSYCGMETKNQGQTWLISDSDKSKADFNYNDATFDYAREHVQGSDDPSVLNLNSYNITQIQSSLHCNSSTEICRINPKCDGSKNDLLLKCVYCDLKNPLKNSQQKQQQLPLAPRLLAKSSESKFLTQQNQNLK